MNTSNFGTPVRVSATGAIKKIPGQLVGFYVNASASGIIGLQDTVAGGGTDFVVTIALTAGAYVPMPAAFNTGLYMTLVSGTANVTFFVV